MSRRTTRAIFLERRSYRLRRTEDAAGLLPLVGLALFLVPLLWTLAPDAPPRTAEGVIWLFAVWGALIIGAVVIALRLSRLSGGEEASGENTDTGPRDDV